MKARVYSHTLATFTLRSNTRYGNLGHTDEQGRDYHVCVAMLGKHAGRLRFRDFAYDTSVRIRISEILTVAEVDSGAIPLLVKSYPHVPINATMLSKGSFWVSLQPAVVHDAMINNMKGCNGSAPIVGGAAPMRIFVRDNHRGWFQPNNKTVATASGYNQTLALCMAAMGPTGHPVASDFVYEFPLGGRFHAPVTRKPMSQWSRAAGSAVRLMRTNIIKLGGGPSNTLDSNVLPVYVTKNIFQKVSIRVVGENLHWGRHFVSFQSPTSKCVGEEATIGRPTPMEVVNVFTDHHHTINSIGYLRTGTTGAITATSKQLSQATPHGQERVVCAAAIADLDPSGVQHHDFWKMVGRMRVAIVEIATINRVANGSIPVLWKSKTTLHLAGVGFQYGDSYISIQPYHSRCDGATSTTGDSWPIKLTAVNRTSRSVRRRRAGNGH